MAFPNGTATEPGKIFVGGLSWETDKEKLEAYFVKYGEIVESVVMVDGVTKKPRGFGFVTFKNPEIVPTVIHSGPHILDGKTIDPKPATVKGSSQQQQQQQPQQQPQQQRYQQRGAVTGKIFIGGVGLDTTEEDVKRVFSHCGTVTEVDLKVDKSTNRLRGFGFVTFESEESVEKAVQTHFHQLNGKTVEAKYAEARQHGQQQATQQSPYQYPNPAAVASYGTNTTAAAAAYLRMYPQYNQYYNQYYQQQPTWTGGYGAAGQQSAVSSTGYTGQEAHAMYSQTSGADGYGGHSHGYNYDNSGAVPSQTANAASYPQQTYGDTSAAAYGSTMAQHSATQQRGGYYNN